MLPVPEVVKDMAEDISSIKARMEFITKEIKEIREYTEKLDKLVADIVELRRDTMKIGADIIICKDKLR